MNGVDVASYQYKLKPSAMSTTDFVIVKFTQGTWYVNPYAEQQYSDAKKAGKLLGAYHYAEGGDPVKEADFFMEHVGTRIGDCILALDWEGKSNKAFSSAKCVEWCRAFLDRVREKTCALPLIYMSKSVTRRYYWKEVAKTYHLWCAQYGSGARTDYQKDPWTDKNSFGAWDGDTIRQYSSKGDIKGYGGNIDLNLAYLDKVGWAALASAQAPKIEKYDRSSIVGFARSHLGTVEGSREHKAIIDKYNSHKPLARGYKVKYTDAWCATYISYLAIAMGYTDIIPTECGCPQMVTLAKQMGIWVEDDAYRPLPGDIVLYDWQDSGKGDNVGTPDHIGIVLEVRDHDMTIEEGNLHDAVATRELEINGRYIRGWIVPKYSVDDVVTDDIHMVKWEAVMKVESKVYRQPDTKSAQCSFSPITQGAGVGVCKGDGKFYLVRYGARFGYVHKSHLTKKA